MGVYAGVCFSPAVDPGRLDPVQGAWVVRALGDRGSGLMGSVNKGQAMASNNTRKLGTRGKNYINLSLVTFFNSRYYYVY
jgi:hypothetical protein